MKLISLIKLTYTFTIRFTYYMNLIHYMKEIPP